MLTLENPNMLTKNYNKIDHERGKNPNKQNIEWERDNLK